MTKLFERGGKVPSLLAVYGSPRRAGNTSVLLDYFLEGIGGAPLGATAVVSCAVEKVHLRELNFTHCTECGGCGKTGVCRVSDDMSGIYEKLLTYERIVMAIPVFFLGPPAIAKTFIDRAQSLWVRKYVLGIKPERGDERKGFLLSVGGFKGSERIFACNRSVVRAFYQSCGFRYDGELLVPGVDHLGGIDEVEGIREKAREAGRNFVR